MRSESTELTQVVPTMDERCGISNFAAQLGGALAAQGVEVGYSRSWIVSTQPVLLHHHPELMSPAEVSRGVEAARGPVLLLSHEKPEALTSVAFDGYVHLIPPSCGLARGGSLGRPQIVLGHPAWTAAQLRPRAEVRQELGLPLDKLILGSSGLLRRNREFPRLLGALLPRAVARGWFIYLPTSRWRVADLATETTLSALERRHPETFRFETSFKEPAELNARLQACDLLWNWTNTKATRYASGTVADQYASGSRLLVSSRPQHDAVLGRPNVYCAAPDFNEFLKTLEGLAELSWAERTDDGVRRHFPESGTWEHAATQIMELVKRVHQSKWDPNGRDLRPFSRR